MADNDFFDDLAKKSAGYKLGVVLIPLVLGGMLYWQFFYTDISDRLSYLESRQSTLLSEQRQLDSDLEQKKRLLQRMEELEQSIRANQRALPTQPEMSGFFDFLQRRAGESGVTISKWEQLKPEKVDVYVRVPVRLEIAGDFMSLVRYFYLLGPRALATAQDGEGIAVSGDRIVSVEDLHLSDTNITDGDAQMVARFVASTFHLDISTQPAAPSPPGQPGQPTPPQPGQ
ncbi:type 4a pilus biogenesis protein PilO [Haliangium sp.]|uniref:type 4a pilus biogenesis protein PilO n=1 Tax=Haliangium sp. TaxID=2663208 RepID=UPI003D11630C